MFSKGLGKDGYSFDAQEKMCREHQLDEAFAALIDAISLKPGVVAWLQKAIEIRLKHLEKAQNKATGGLKVELSKKQTELERLYDEGWERGIRRSL